MRRNSVRLLLILGSAVVTPSVAPTQSVGSQLRRLLPHGTVSVEILEPWAPARMNELAERMKRAAQADPSWLMEAVKRAAPGEPLPYDPRLGLSEAEYREFLRLNDNIEMRSMRHLTIVIERIPSGWRFGSAIPIDGLAGLAIDTVANVVHSSFGDLPSADPIVPSDGQRATGRWGGPRWKVDSLDEAMQNGRIAAFAIGRHEDTGRTVIYFDGKRAVNGQLVRRNSCFLRILE